MRNLIYINDDHSFGYEVFKQHAKGGALGALDIETTWLEANPWSHPPELVCLGVTFDGHHVFIFKDDKWLVLAKTVLETNPFIMQNGLFDRLMLKQFFDLDVKLVHDTMAMQYLLNPDLPKGLEILSERYLGLGPYKNVDYKNILDEPFEKVAEMNAEDVCRTYDLMRPLADQINSDPALARVYQWILMPAVNNLIKITQTGIPLDRERLSKLTETTESKVRSLLSRLRNDTPLPGDAYPDGWPRPSSWKIKTDGPYEPPGIFNPASPKQVGHILYDLWGLRVLEYTKKDNKPTTTPSTNADVLLRLETHEAGGKQQEWLGLLRDFRKQAKALSYYQAWPELSHEGWLHPRYKPLHVVTGRLSSEKPNIMQVPRDTEVRACFGNVEGYTWVKADYSQIELRIAAWMAQEKSMLRAYAMGMDLHALTAELVLGDDSSEARYTGKVLNFGLLYGSGPATLQRIGRSNYGVDMSFAEAKSYKKDFFLVYPGLADWHKKAEKEICRTGVSRSRLGRIRYLPHAKIPNYVVEMRGKRLAAIREGINHQVQSFASDLLLMSLNKIMDKLPEGASVIAEVHDEIDLLVPDAQVLAVGEMVRREMEDVSWLSKHGIELGVPVVAEIEVGKNWGELEPL